MSLSLGHSTRVFLCLFWSLAALGVLRAAAPQDVSFVATADGSEQRYQLLGPDGLTRSQPVDLIIALHGHGADRHQFLGDGRAECAAFRDFVKKHGLLAVAPDYRAPASWMGPKAEADLLQIIADLKKTYAIRRVFLVGGSMGGTSTLTFTALHPELFAGIMAMNPHANLLEFENFQDYIAASYGGTKVQIPEEYKKRSAEYWPEKFTMPVAVTVGGKDTVVPPDSAVRLMAILKKLNPNVLLIERPETGHETNYEDVTTALEFMLARAKP